MLTDELIAQLAQSLRTAELQRTPITPLRDQVQASSERDAYAIQLANVEHAIQQGRRVVGRKIGLTSISVQRQLGVEQPDFGTLFADMIYGDDDVIPLDKVLQPKVEAEIALVLKTDLPAIDTTLIELISAVDYVLPAIEIVSSRISDWDIRFFDTVADNASSGLVVLGAVPVKLEGLDLKTVEMTMCRNDEQASFGSGAACLGHPLNAAAWLARKLAAFGQPLRAGDLVLTGALGPMVTVKPGDAFEAHITGVGTVRTRFADRD